MQKPRDTSFWQAVAKLLTPSIHAFLLSKPRKLYRIHSQTTKPERLSIYKCISDLLEIHHPICFALWMSRRRVVSPNGRAGEGRPSPNPFSIGSITYIAFRLPCN